MQCELCGKTIEYVKDKSLSADILSEEELVKLSSFKKNRCERCKEDVMIGKITDSFLLVRKAIPIRMGDT